MHPLSTMFAETIAAQHADLFDPVVRLAYSAGATPEELLTAVETAKAQAEVPPGVVQHAYTTVHNWRWIAARQEALRLKPAVRRVA